jgi:glycosyltransferase involved in cell wall biosynthesis
MKILILHQYFLEEDGAGGSRFNEFSRLWTEMGHEVVVIAGMMPDQTMKKRPEYQGKSFMWRKQGNVDVLRCHVSESYNKSFLGRIAGYFSFMWSSMYAGIFKLKQKPDLILVTSPPLFIGITAILLSKIKGVPFVFEVRDLWPESAVDTGVLKNKFLINLFYKLEALIYKKSSLINVLTPAFKTNLIEKKNIHPEKVIFIPNSADFDLSEELLHNFNPENFRKEKGVEDKFVITYVGAHGKANGLHQILQTAKLLEDTNVVFWLIGKGMYKPKLVQEAAEMGVKNVVFFDPVPKKEVFKFILASDMGASVLLKNDTFKTVYSNKTFDYMACKKPILMAIDGISRDLVEEANAGMFVDPENPKEFERIIRHYLSNPDLIKEQGESGYHFAKANFDRSVLAKKYFSFISKKFTEN